MARVILSFLCIVFNTFLSFCEMERGALPVINAPVRSSVAGLSDACVAATNEVNKFVGDSNPLTARFNHRSDKTHREALAFQPFIVPSHVQSPFLSRPQYLSCLNRFPVVRDSAFRPHAPPGMNGYFLLFLLSFLVVLFRSNLPWGSVVISQDTSTRPSSVGRVSFLSGRIPL